MFLLFSLFSFFLSLKYRSWAMFFLSAVSYQSWLIFFKKVFFIHFWVYFFYNWFYRLVCFKKLSQPKHPSVFAIWQLNLSYKRSCFLYLGNRFKIKLFVNPEKVLSPLKLKLKMLNLSSSIIEYQCRMSSTLFLRK